MVVPGLIVLSPLIAIVAGVVWFRFGSPVLFRQTRPGLGGRPFTALKFRTMTSQYDAKGRWLEDGERLTPTGRFLRKTSLDELPQLWNVLRGDMSLVGPRPLLMQYLPNYTPEQNRRHDVMPGITGWAQVHGRNGALFSERLKMDVWYVDNWSWSLDLRILGRTLIRVLGCSGAKPEEDIDTMDDVGLGTQMRAENRASRKPPTQEFNS